MRGKKSSMLFSPNQVLSHSLWGKLQSNSQPALSKTDRQGCKSLGLPGTSKCLQDLHSRTSYQLQQILQVKTWSDVFQPGLELCGGSHGGIIGWGWGAMCSSGRVQDLQSSWGKSTFTAFREPWKGGGRCGAGTADERQKNTSMRWSCMDYWSTINKRPAKSTNYT